MDCPKDSNIFGLRIQTVSQRAEQLYQNAREVPWQEPDVVVGCLDDLRLALEELHVAEEEIFRQNFELIESRQAVEAEKQRYQELFEFAPDGYLVTDMYGTISEANRAAAKLLNIEQKHLCRKPLVNFVAEDQRRPFRALLNQLSTIDRLQEWEMQMCRRQDGSFEAALTVETVRNEQEQAIALRWLLRDITERKQAEAQLRQMQLQNLELLEANRLKSQFMATLSHELRTPMNAILGFSELLLRRLHGHDPQGANMVERIFRNGRHLLALIEEMLDFSKLQAYRLELQLEPLNLAELLKATIDELQSLAVQKGLSLRVDLLQDEIWVVNDRTRLHQMLHNILSNAIKFTEVGSVMVKIYELPENRVAIAISDTGIGIADIDQPHIFQEFWQVNQTLTRQHSGTGLGLTISKALVDLMRGSISVESRPGEGTTFLVEFPCQVESNSR